MNRRFTWTSSNGNLTFFTRIKTQPLQVHSHLRRTEHRLDCCPIHCHYPQYIYRRLVWQKTRKKADIICICISLDGLQILQCKCSVHPWRRNRTFCLIRAISKRHVGFYRTFAHYKLINIYQNTKDKTIHASWIRGTQQAVKPSFQSIKSLVKSKWHANLFTYFVTH